MGYWASKFTTRDGGKIIGIVERDASIYKADGIDIEEAKAYYTEHGTFVGYTNCDEIETANPASFMEKETDYLIPAAVEKSITMDNADRIKCKAVFEGGNGPTTFAGEEILLKKGIVVAPDLLVNGGGVTCSYFEWLKNIAHVSPGKMTKKFEQQSKI